MARRIDYDKIAHLYDNNPIRVKKIDPDLLAYLELLSEKQRENIAILDIGCGTGTQLHINKKELPQIRMVGMDLSGAMIEKAKEKSDKIEWIQADAAQMPFQDEEFHFISSQYQFHHIVDQQSALNEAYRVLHPKGRLAIWTLCPEAMKDWAVYKYFPKTRDFDLRDQPPIQILKDMLTKAGFTRVHFEVEYERYEFDFQKMYEAHSHKDYNSQTQMLSKAEYDKGLERLHQDLEISQGTDKKGISEIALMKIICDKTNRDPIGKVG